MLLILAMFGVLYFLMIRPQMKRAKEHKAMVEGLQKGDEVITAGGILGRITKVDAQYATVSVADNVEIQIQRAAIQIVLPKGTLIPSSKTLMRKPALAGHAHRPVLFLFDAPHASPLTRPT